MTDTNNELVMMFTGGTDTTIAAARIMEGKAVKRLHLLTFCNGICVKVENSRVHVDELMKQYGEERLHHEIIYVTELFKTIRSPLRELIKQYNSTLVFDLCCRLSMETAAIIYALDHDITRICDGTNIDQGRLFLERPEYLRVSKEYFASFGIDYFSPVYAPSGGRLGRREELTERGFTVGPKFLERLNITTCLGTQPFCLMAFHTFFFTSFLRKAPLLRLFIARHNLSLEKAIELRLDRQTVARQAVKDHQSFNQLADDGQPIRVREHFCTTKLCGRNGVEIALPQGIIFDLESLAEAWRKQGINLSNRGGFIACKKNGLEIQVFRAARVMITGTKNPDKATALYQELVAAHDPVRVTPPADSPPAEPS